MNNVFKVMLKDKQSCFGLHGSLGLKFIFNSLNFKNFTNYYKMEKIIDNKDLKEEKNNDNSHKSEEHSEMDVDEDYNNLDDAGTNRKKQWVVKDKREKTGHKYFIRDFEDGTNPDNSSNLEKIKLPKRKYAIIHGYLGHNYCGNQKNPGVPSVEEVIERILYNQGYISPCNYGILQKISWSRASRTDKKVSAAMNLISCKLHQYDDRKMQDIVSNLNKDLVKDDIAIINIIEVSGSFDAKECTNNREYHYIIPSFCLEPLITKSQDDKQINLNYKISPEFKEKLQTFCSAFKGTKRYHNYTRKIAFSDGSAQRVIYEVSVSEILEFEGVEYIKFKLIGQSFLYNQIRKMIGMIVECMRNNKSIEFFEETFANKIVPTAKAPAEGLYLFTIDYSRYNDRKGQKKNKIELTDEDLKKINDFSVKLREKVHESEVKNKVFSIWLQKFDAKDREIYLC